MTLKEKLIEVANGLESESIRYPRMKTIDVVNMLINIYNMEFDESDQCLQIAKDYAEQEAIEFASFLRRYCQADNNFLYWWYAGEKYNEKQLYQLFKNRENER